MICEFCKEWPNATRLNERTPRTSDITVKVDPRGLLHCSHYDIEGNTDDDRIAIPINFCPVCGREFE